MKLRWQLAVASAVFILPHLPAASRAADDTSPEAVVRVATEALNHGRTEEFARAMHPEALRKFREVMTAFVDAAAKDGKADQVLKLFPSVTDVEGLKRLDDVSFFADYLRGATARDPSLKSALANSKIEVLGHVAEGKETTHVVYRMSTKVDGTDFDGIIQVASLGKHGTNWKMLLSSDVETMTLMMKQRISAKPAAPDLKATKIQPLGHFLEGSENAHLVYRIATPLGDTALKKVNVLSVKKSDPGWKVVRAGDTEAIIKLVKEQLGL
jgi:hypothetical protein